MNDQIKKNKLLACPNCQGSGQGKMGFGCFDCQGMGQGLFFKNWFLFFKLDLVKENIFFPQLKNIIDKTLILLSFIIFFLGLIALGAWYYLNFPVFDNWSNYLFWNYKSIYLFFFWIGIVFFMFAFYKFQKIREETKKISNLKEIDKPLPENWEEIRKYKYLYNVSQSLDSNSLKIIARSYKIAKKLKHKEINTFHLFSALLIEDRQVSALFFRLRVDLDELISKVNHQLIKLNANQKNKQSLVLSPGFKKTFILGFKEAYLLKQTNVTPLNLVYYCVQENKTLEEILIDLEINLNKVENVKIWFRTNDQIKKDIKRYQKMARFKPRSNMDRAYTSVATPFLNRCGYDLTLAAKYGGLSLCLAREEEIKTIFNSLTGSKNGVILVGPEGVGKSTIVKGIARLMVEEEVPIFLQDKRLVELDLSRLISGSTPSQMEERILTVLDEVALAENIVLYIKNINNLVGIKIGDQGSLDLSEALIDGLERRGIYCLTTATLSNFHQYVEASALAEFMEKIEISEPNEDQAIKMIESKIGNLEAKFKGIVFSYNAIDKAVVLSKRYIHDKYLPQKALDILEQTGIRLSKSKNKKQKFIFCTRNDVALTVKEITNIPVDQISEGEGKKLLNLEKEIHKHLINQNEAVDVVANSLRRARADLKEEKRTIANFLFLGPTGVGKTELAKTVAKVYLGKKDFMFRVDMSEYQHEDSVKKMIGDAQGRKGYLTEAVRQNPFSLILLDEFEKAHPKILDLFLQVMDDSRLTDGQGRTIDFSSSIIIATSNAGSKYIEKQIMAGEKIETIKEVLINEKLMEVMKPELINRFDGVVIFKPLSMKNVIEITRLMIKNIEKMLLDKGVFLQVSDKGLRKLAQEGYDPKFGARPLRRVLRERLENKIAKKILGEELERRDTVIVNDLAEIEIKKRKEF